MPSVDQHTTKQCAYCLQNKPLSEFRRRTGRRSKAESRRGACRECRKRREAESARSASLPETAQTKALTPAPLTVRAAAPPKARPAGPARAAAPAPGSPAKPPAKERSAPESAPTVHTVPAAGGASAPSPAGEVPAHKPRKRKRSRGTAAPERKPHASASEGAAKPRPRTAEQAASLQRQRGPKPEPDDISALIPSRQGMILMRGYSDKGRRWHQEIDLDLAVTLVREQAAVVVNRRTIRRLYSNKDFRRYILTRDRYTCHFCGLYGDTIDHLLPRAKGGHTTPMNCVCACNLCNQAKADQYVDEFMGN
ncbi:HNH endonuclease [Paenibacillus rhizophilus]|nr:HNH endonuclease signature motif containing protein [Paenibacillus rhizophilus]